MSIFFKCGAAHDFEDLKEKLSGMPGVKMIAKVQSSKKGLEEGMVEVESQEAGEAAVAAIQEMGAEYLSQPSVSEEVTGAPKRAVKKEKNDGKTKDFFDNFATLKESRQRQKREELEENNRLVHGNSNSTNTRGRGRKEEGNGGRGGRGGGGRGFSNSNEGNNNRSSSRNGGRGGRGGRGRRGYVMPHFIEGHVASINNVPTSMTNDQIATVFDECGTIYDIARYETLAMVFFDCQDSVVNAIMLVNGTRKLNGSLSTVSDGGTLRVPIPQNLNPQALSSHAIQMHQQGMMPSLQDPTAAAAESKETVTAQ